MKTDEFDPVAFSELLWDAVPILLLCLLFLL